MRFAPVGASAAKRGCAARDSAISIKLRAGFGSGKAKQGPLIVPSQRQTRLYQQLVCGQPARLAPVENGSRDVRGEIAEADKPCEIGWADAFLLGQCGKRYAVAAGEGGIEPVRPDQQLDQPRIGFGCRKRVGPLGKGVVKLSGRGMLVVSVARQLRWGNSFARLLCCPTQAERGRKKAL